VLIIFRFCSSQFMLVYIPHRCNLSRKEKCSGEDTSNIKEVTVPTTKQHHQFNALDKMHKMMWLQNQNNKNDLERYYLYFYWMQNFCFVCIFVGTILICTLWPTTRPVFLEKSVLENLNWRLWGVKRFKIC
jgi:hypothetical protein